MGCPCPVSKPLFRHSNLKNMNIAWAAQSASNSAIVTTALCFVHIIYKICSNKNLWKYNICAVRRFSCEIILIQEMVTWGLCCLSAKHQLVKIMCSTVSYFYVKWGFNNRWTVCEYRLALLFFFGHFFIQTNMNTIFWNLWANGFKIKIFRLLVFTKFSTNFTVSLSLTRLTTSLLLIVSVSSAIFDPINYTPPRHSWCFVC